MVENAPLVSVIIPVYNRPDMLLEAVNSVLTQTWRPLEIIVVDDGSTDETTGQSDRLAETYPEVKVIHQENAGAGAAREAGRLVARGEYIQYLDSDDLLLPDKLEHQIAALRSQPECDLAYGKTTLLQQGREPDWTAWKDTGRYMPQIFPHFLWRRAWVTSSPLIKRELSDRAGPWLSLRNNEDWEYDCRLGALGAQLCFVDEFVSITRRHDSNISGQLPEKASLYDRAQVQQLIWQHAKMAGIKDSEPAAQHFASSVFLLARQCASMGMSKESEQLLALTGSIEQPLGKRLNLSVYRLITALVGGELATRFTQSMYNLTSRRSE